VGREGGGGWGGGRMGVNISRVDREGSGGEIRSGAGGEKGEGRSGHGLFGRTC